MKRSEPSHIGQITLWHQCMGGRNVCHQTCR